MKLINFLYDLVDRFLNIRGDVFCGECKHYNMHCSHKSNMYFVKNWHMTYLQSKHKCSVLNKNNNCKNFEVKK